MKPDAATNRPRKTPSTANSDPTSLWLARPLTDYAPRLRARLALIDDATGRGWQREIERPNATKRRLEQVLHDVA